MEAQIEELTLASAESATKTAEVEQQLQQLREEKEEVDVYVSELEAASLAEGVISVQSANSIVRLNENIDQAPVINRS